MPGSVGGRQKGGKGEEERRDWGEGAFVCDEEGKV